MLPEKGARFAGVVANGDDGIEGDMPEGIYMFRNVRGNIHQGLGHHLNRSLIETMRLNAG